MQSENRKHGIRLVYKLATGKAMELIELIFKIEIRERERKKILYSFK